MSHASGWVAPDALVIGGGLVGLAIASELAGRGARVTLLDRGRIARGAARAAAGMLAAQCENEEPGPFFDLCLRARSLHAGWSAQLLAETGIAVEYEPVGILRLAQGVSEAERLRRRGAWQRDAGQRAEWIEGEELGSWVRETWRLPLAPGIEGALWLPDDHRLSAVRLLRALARQAAARGVRLFSGRPATGWVRRGSRIRGVETPEGPVEAPVILLAAGAWSGDLARRGGFPLPVDGLRGETLAIAPPQPSPPQSPPPTLFGAGAYLVPKAGARCLLGATEVPEPAPSSRRRPTLGAAAVLSEQASRFLPGIGAALLLGGRSGLRPQTPDGRPALGPVPGEPGLFVATGHRRNGVLLSRLTALLLADCVEGRGMPEWAAPFSPARFSQPSGL